MGISEAKEARKHRQRVRGVDVEDLVRVDDGEDREKEPEGPDVCTVDRERKRKVQVYVL